MTNNVTNVTIQNDIDGYVINDLKMGCEFIDNGKTYN